MDFFPSIDRYRSGGFPEETAKLAEALADAETLRTVTSEVEQFSDAYAQMRGLLRFHYHNIPEILDSLYSLSHPWRECASDLPEIPEAGHFITEDEVDEALSRGSQMSGGKMRISFGKNTASAAIAARFQTIPAVLKTMTGKGSALPNRDVQMYRLPGTL